jgi:uncharacterized protein YndB with AHSA1/START domain
VTSTAERTLTFTRILDAPRDVVWRAWTDPAHLVWYLNPQSPRDEPIHVDLRVGGAWRLRMFISEETDYITGGIYREIVPNEKLVFTWGAIGGWPEYDPADPDANPVITIVLNELAGSTEMTTVIELREGMSDERAQYFLGSGMQEGWPMTIDRLVALYPPS